MKTIGMVGGMSWESSIEYSLIINAAVTVGQMLMVSWICRSSTPPASTPWRLSNLVSMFRAA